MRILHIEDDLALARSVDLMLRAEKMTVYSTDIGEEGISLAKRYDYDIIILDLGLPDMSGFQVLRAMRAAGVHTPVIILSGDARVESKVQLLNAGADDYMTKPFHKDELVARIYAVVRRAHRHCESVILTGKLALNVSTKTVTVEGSRVRLTSKEYLILELLSLRKGTTVTKDLVLDHLYGGVDEPKVRILDVFVFRLRKKLAVATGGDTYIETVRECGFVLNNPGPSIQAVAA